MPSHLLPSKLAQIPTQDYIVSSINREQIDFLTSRILDVPVICLNICVFNVYRTIGRDRNFLSETFWIRYGGMIRNRLTFVGSCRNGINEINFYGIYLLPVFFHPSIHPVQLNKH